MKNKIFIYIIFATLIFSDSYLELDIGHHNPQGSFDKYSEPGFSFRASYSWPDEKHSHIKYDFSVQNYGERFPCDFNIPYLGANKKARRKIAVCTKTIEPPVSISDQ